MGLFVSLSPVDSVLLLVCRSTSVFPGKHEVQRLKFTHNQPPFLRYTGRPRFLTLHVGEIMTLHSEGRPTFRLYSLELLGLMCFVLTAIDEIVHMILSRGCKVMALLELFLLYLEIHVKRPDIIQIR